MKLKLNVKAEKVIDKLALDIGSSDGFWYDLTKGGYFKPEDVLADKSQIKEVKEAIKLLKELEEIYDQIVPEF